MLWLRIVNLATAFVTHLLYAREEYMQDGDIFTYSYLWWIEYCSTVWIRRYYASDTT